MRKYISILYMNIYKILQLKLHIVYIVTASCSNINKALIDTTNMRKWHCQAFHFLCAFKYCVQYLPIYVRSDTFHLGQNC